MHISFLFCADDRVLGATSQVIVILKSLLHPLFISDVFSDDCEEVESLTQEVIAEMEKTLGEPLQNYF